MPDLSSQVRPAYQRRRYLVDRALQLRLAYRLLTAVLLLSLLAGSVMYLGAVFLIERQLYTPHLFHDSSGELLLPLFVWLNLGLVVLLAAGIMLLVRRYLAAAAGSIGRLERHLETFAAGELPLPINFRRRDPLAPVAAACNRLVAAVRRRRQEVERQLRQLEEQLARLEDEQRQGKCPAAGLTSVAAGLAAARRALDVEVKE